ncbi:hypothetical protein [Aliterella atlantica]|uniref:Leucine rich repeat variant n=1 Tax=Aliterella atlantica CENA595 TaxID=1618023 RepID=A0A0D8ZTH0_9CYAN|nr:hypothetical protein [Aliterella atlantica]KJH72068.1 hypothetical protein UH38_08305 [Aliterella atlantica CENA595]
MVDFCDRELKKIASNSSSSPALLTELSNNSDFEIRSLVASNPNTPVDILMKLGEEFPDQILENPVFNLLLLEEPDSRFVRLSLARSTKTNPEVLAKLAATEKHDETICCAVARNINTPIDTLKSMVVTNWHWRDGNFPLHLTYEVLTNSSMPIAYLEELLCLSIGCEELLWGFSHLPNLSLRMIEKLAENGAVSPALVEHPIVQKSPILLDKMARSSYDEPALRKILKNPIILPSTVEYLAGYNSPAIRNIVIERSDVSKKALDIVLFMQKKLGTPIDLLNELAEDYRFQKLLIDYPYTPSEVLEKTVDCYYVPKYNHDFDKREREYKDAFNDRNMVYKLACHPNTSFKLLERICVKLTQWAAYNDRTDKEMLRIVQDRLYNHYVVQVDTEKEPKIIGDRYSRENLFEPEPEDEIPF